MDGALSSGDRCVMARGMLDLQAPLPNPRKLRFSRVQEFLLNLVFRRLARMERSAFAANPSLVWEFYHYRRCIVSKALPNAGHYAITALENRCRREGKQFKLLTQNVDGLHFRAGTVNIEELHGSMWKTRCCTCDEVKENFDMPICEALDGKGSSDPAALDANIPRQQLPRCRSCNGLLRPHVVWFGESLDLGVMERAHESLTRCDLLLVAGTSAVVQPAAGFIPLVKGGGGTIAEFNLEETPVSRYCRYRFQGTCVETLPRSLGIPQQELQQLEQQGDDPSKREP